jgi:hypothetical protein
MIERVQVALLESPSRSKKSLDKSNAFNDRFDMHVLGEYTFFSIIS